MIASRTSFDPQSSEPLSNSAKVYVPGKLHRDVRVPFREITLTPTKSFNGRSEPNEPLRVYDCSGPWSDPEFHGEVQQGLPPLRKSWIHSRGDVEETARTYRPIAGRSDTPVPAGLARQPLRAKRGKVVSQLHYARQGIITPEMEFIAIRENLARQQTNSRTHHASRNLGSESFGASIPEQITAEFVQI